LVYHFPLLHLPPGFLAPNYGTFHGTDARSFEGIHQVSRFERYMPIHEWLTC